MKPIKYRSKYERSVASYCKHHKIPVLYEKTHILFNVNEQRSYTPDFELEPNVFLEAKGRFYTSDRKKITLIKKQHPHIKIYLLFQNSRVKLSKKSKTTYGEWCTKHGIEWADFGKEGVPKKWLEALKIKGKNESCK